MESKILFFFYASDGVESGKRSGGAEWGGH